MNHYYVIQLINEIGEVVSSYRVNGPSRRDSIILIWKHRYGKKFNKHTIREVKILKQKSK